MALSGHGNRSWRSRFLPLPGHQDRILGPKVASLKRQDPIPLAESSVELEETRRAFDLQDYEGDGSQGYVTRIPVTRQKYIQVSKLDLVTSLSQGLRSSAGDDEEGRSQFLTICSCLESILHAEHKSLLEELRVDSFAAISQQDRKSTLNIKENGRAAAPSSRTSRFQQNIMLVLRRAQFQELSARDLQLTTALNSDYLLTLPIDIDWKSTSSANVIIFRRGYATEKQEGFLFGAKLDYLQSWILRRVFYLFARPLLGKMNVENTWTEALRKWLEEPLAPDELFEYQGHNLPMWAAAQRAVPRYEAVLSSAGSRGKLIRRFLTWMRILPPEKTEVTNLFPESSPTKEPSLRPSYLNRVSMGDILLPALESKLRSSVWEKLKNVFSVFLTKSSLEEPAFKELVVMHERAPVHVGVDPSDHLRLELNTYNNIPVPDLKVVFPNKKLSFRLLDTVRLDLTTIAGLLAFLVNYRFDDLLSSPSAFILDIVATVSLLVFVTRVSLGYKQTWDRYQLLVSKRLNEKTLASGFGVVHFLIDASEEQQVFLTHTKPSGGPNHHRGFLQFKQAVLLYGLLLHSRLRHEDTNLDHVGSICEQYVNDRFKQQIEMPVKEAVETLSRLGVITVLPKEGKILIQAVPHEEAIGSLRKRWQNLLTGDHKTWHS
ncbi:uncharacterized protein LOC9655169 isoform X2 [Selaginella moellendorffii]|uniref:uncharacterized protein LOC9655169 isoform X2 n=1 Tax=Selaginella moellendorffii TaxID=88036 RepID=UPI000D1CAF48|nr:uncharacterized protein LOC9655169 isoform X2 [Selaginella moellendorffii]|eukprot:XP_024520559.1 uncharacterized protein LOC9655169 isoform X2 [Selaginella moellendorffii]